MIPSNETRIETYVPLYRKYRPQVFADVVGQEAIVQTLGNAIRLNRVAHAYLFCGPRGTGKTSTARIFAKSLNCEQGPTLTPCLQCASCTGIAQGNALDVIEFDAASNNGVGDARELIENCQYSSMSGRFKVYIVDEVHMLTPQAFNALLKTLEEPPANVIFVFATTEAHKVLPTIVSRCQRFDFNRITTADITTRLEAIAATESISIEAEALRMIARHARGGLRDAVGLLDQVAVLGRGQVDRRITPQDVALFIGTLEEDRLLRLSQSIAQRNPAALLEDLNELANRGLEPLQLLKDVSSHFRNLLIVQAAGDSVSADALSLSTDYCDALKAQRALFPDAEELPQILGRLASIERNVRHSTHPQVWLEVGLLELVYRHDIHLVKTLSERISQLEASLATMSSGGGLSNGKPNSISPVAPPAATSVPAPTQAIPPSSPAMMGSMPSISPPAAYAGPTTSAQASQPAPAKEILQAATSSASRPAAQSSGDSGVSETDYQRICAAVPSLTLRSLLQQQAFPLRLSGDVLSIGVTSEPNLAVLKKPDRLIHVEKAAEQCYGRPIRIDLQLEKNRPAVSPAPSAKSPSRRSALPPEPTSAPVLSFATPTIESIQTPSLSPSASPVAIATPTAAPGPRPPAMAAVTASQPIDFSAPPPAAGSASAPAISPSTPSSPPLWQDDGPPPLMDSDAPFTGFYEEDDPVLPNTPRSVAVLPSMPVKPVSSSEPDVIESGADPLPTVLPTDGDPALREAQKHALDILQGKILEE